MSRSWSVSELAQSIGATVQGNGDTRISGVGTITGAGPSQITFLANASYRRHLPECRAGAVVVSPDDAEGITLNSIISDNPYAAYARLAANFAPGSGVAPGVHPSAVVDPDAHLDSNVAVGPLAVIAAGARIGAGTVVGAGTIIEQDATIGAGCHLHPRVTLGRRVTVGDRVVMASGVVVGADGFGIAQDAGRWIKVPQLGSVVIGDDCDIGANTAIDRGALEDTVLEEDVRLDNLIQIAHNVRIGAHTAMAGCSAVAGSATIGRYCLIGGGAGILGHIEIADRVTIYSMTLVTHSIKDSGTYASGTPVQPHAEWRRNAVRMKHLDEMARSLKKMEKKQ